MRTNILTVEIDNYDYNKVIQKIDEFFTDDKKHYIVTPNPEITLKALKDSYYRAILNNADISLPDGFGIILGSIFLGGSVYKRVTGSDLCYKIFEFADKKQCPIFILGGLENSAKIAKDKIEKIYKNIKIYTDEGFSDIKNIKNGENEKIINQINNTDAKILLVAYGAPFQEKWTFENIEKLSNIKVAIGVGGAIDFISGKAIRAPKLIRKIGFEWLWRLSYDPKRINRIFDAVIKYLYYLIKWKIHLLKPFRNGVVSVIINSKNEILVIKEIYEKNWYRFPQGGVEKNEDPQNSLLREIYEETGFSNVKILGTADKISSHYWPMDKWCDIPKYKRNYNQKFCGQKQTIYFLKTTSDEIFNSHEQEIIDHKWVKKEDLIKYISPVKRNLLKIALKNIDKYLN